MKFSAKKYAEALDEALDSCKPSDSEKILDNFVQILADNNDLRMFDAIAEEYHKRELAKKGKKLAEVTTARPLAPDTEKQIIDTLNRVIKSDVELKNKIDGRIIGGCVIRVDDTVIDASIKHSLEELKNKLAE